MFRHSQNNIVSIAGKTYENHVILADVNIPYRFNLDREKNTLFFCINADEFSDQSFHSVVLELDTNEAKIVHNVKNGFASAVDHGTGAVYLGGSEGIYKYNYATHDVDLPAIIQNIDIFDMFFHKNLYYVDTSHQYLHVFKNKKSKIYFDKLPIHHFVINSNEDLFFVNPAGLYVKYKNEEEAILCDESTVNCRGSAICLDGIPHFIAEDGIYKVNQNKRLSKIFTIENGYGLAFDKDNNIVYSSERSVNKLIATQI